MMQPMNTKLDQSVLELLKARKGDWPRVVADSGVSYSWLSKFVNGHITNPGYATLNRLYEVMQVPELAPAPANQPQSATTLVAAKA
jgi:transcriptional regulator with XRE-family HTH domain